METKNAVWLREIRFAAYSLPCFVVGMLCQAYFQFSLRWVAVITFLGGWILISVVAWQPKRLRKIDDPSSPAVLQQTPEHWSTELDLSVL